MGKHRPHILVTTPESLYILLTAEKSRAMLQTTRTVIVDEIHAVADDKRGSHLALSLARLDALAETKPQRIGLSATVKPIEEVARYLSPRARIVNVGHRPEMELAVEVPRDELGPVASSEMWEEIYDRVAELILSASHHARFRQHAPAVGTSRPRSCRASGRERRPAAPWQPCRELSHDRNAETRLKSGELKAVVATASLELGIDIGTVDLAMPDRIAAVDCGRAAESRAVGSLGRREAEGVSLPTTRDELIECAALVRSIRSAANSTLEIPKAPLDILAQQIVAETAARDWQEEDLYALVRAYLSLSRSSDRKHFDAISQMLSEGIADAARPQWRATCIAIK
jgi:ATP-dependent Lhr-like helicase